MGNAPKPVNAPPAQKIRNEDEAYNMTAGLNNADVQTEKEAQRMAHSFGINPRTIDPKKVAEDKEKDDNRKALEKKLDSLDTSDPKAFSRAFLNDPDVLARLKEVKGIVAVNQLKGTDVPGGHTF